MKLYNHALHPNRWHSKHTCLTINMPSMKIKRWMWKSKNWWRLRFYIWLIVVLLWIFLFSLANEGEEGWMPAWALHCGSKISHSCINEGVNWIIVHSEKHVQYVAIRTDGFSNQENIKCLLESRMWLPVLPASLISLHQGIILKAAKKCNRRCGDLNSGAFATLERGSPDEDVRERVIMQYHLIFL